jgi:hypothetical protein
MFAEVLYNPRRVFTKVDQRRAWWFPYVANALCTALLVAMQVPFAEQMLRASLPPGASPDLPSAVAALNVVQIVMPFLALPLRWMLTSGLLFAIVIAMDWGWPEFGTIFSAVAYSHVVLTLKDAVTVVGLYWRGPGAVSTIADMAVIPTLGNLFTPGSLPSAWVALLNIIEPFALWNVIVMGVAIAVLTRRTFIQALWAPVLVWLLGSMVGVSIGLLF